MTKRLFAVLALLTVLLSACGSQQPPQTTATTQSTTVTTAPSTTTQPTTAPPTGWQSVDGKTVYLNAGIRCTGWQEIEGKRYYFDAEGFMVTGFVELEDGTYYLDDSGNPVTGVFTLEGETYLYQEDGRAYTGFLEAEGETYYYLPNGMMAKGQVTVEDTNWFFDASGKRVIFVNFENPMRHEFTPVLVKWRNFTLETETAAALDAMITAGEDLGYEFSFNASYRTIQKQQNIWDKRYKQYINQGMTPEEANRQVGLSVAVPGYSEHHTGLAADIDSTWSGLSWLAENCWQYGFIVRYPEGKTEFTGIIHEPWHFRYVGTELAKELYDSDLCMEEYMLMLTQQQGR